MLVISLGGTLLTLLLAPVIIHLITGGGRFSDSAASLRILSLSFPAYFISSVLMWSLVTLKKYKSMLLIYIAGLLANGVLNFIFIPRYSYIASSYITGVSEYLILALQAVILLRYAFRHPH